MNISLCTQTRDHPPPVYSHRIKLIALLQPLVRTTTEGGGGGAGRARGSKMPPPAIARPGGEDAHCSADRTCCTERPRYNEQRPAIVNCWTSKI